MTTTTIREFTGSDRATAKRLTEAFEDEGIGLDDPVDRKELAEMADYLDHCDEAELIDAVEDVADAEDGLRIAKAALRRTLADLLENGYSATKAAKVLGVSRARVYQLRDGKR